MILFFGAAVHNIFEMVLTNWNLNSIMVKYMGFKNNIDWNYILILSYISHTTLVKIFSLEISTPVSIKCGDSSIDLLGLWRRACKIVPMKDHV